MARIRAGSLRHVLPWLVSAALLAYAFGWATDWRRLAEALADADVPLFLLCATADRLAFFAIWSWLWAAALRRFVADVSTGSVVALRGGSELLRTVSNPLSDAAFFLGLVRLVGGRFEAVVAAALVPALTHFTVMALQMTVMLPFLDGGPAANRDVAVGVAIAWAIVLGSVAAFALSARGLLRWRGAEPVRAWLERFPLRELWPFWIGFTLLAVFDVLIQGLASRAFGVPIGWAALAARVPLVYFSFLVPTLGNFGTRELAWAALFSEFGPRDALVAYAFAVNAIFLVLNLLLGILFLPRALELASAVRSARRAGQPLARPAIHDPTDL
jgi:hypothetical protein